MIDTGTSGDFLTLYAQTRLGEQLHDQGDDLMAAKYWDDAVQAREAKEKNKDTDAQDLAGRVGPMETMRARAHFFHACHHEKEGDREKQLAELKAGLEQDPAEVDVLIALYRFPYLDAELKEKVRQLVRDSADEFRRQIRETPDDQTAYNQIAWLIANTEGDQDEARRDSERSLELLQPGRGQGHPHERGGFPRHPRAAITRKETSRRRATPVEGRGIGSVFGANEQAAGAV